MLGDFNHKLFDPQLFYSDDEMRKQVELLKGAIVLTAQERPEATARGFREDLFKKMASADAIFGRLPYQVLTKAIAFVGWKCMEVNKLVRFSGVRESCFNSVFRRCLLCKNLRSCYVCVCVRERMFSVVNKH